MTSLVDELLADFEDLEEEGEKKVMEKGEEGAKDGENSSIGHGASSSKVVSEKTREKNGADEGGKDGDEYGEDGEKHEHLLQDERLARLMESIYALESAAPVPTSEREGVVEEDPEYQAILESNEMVARIEQEEMDIMVRLRLDYAIRFPELEAIVPVPLDYAHVVERINDATDLSLVDLSDILPPAKVMSVNISGSMTSGRIMSAGELESAMRNAKAIVELNNMKERILAFVGNRMEYVAPTMCAIVGSMVAARLVGAAGGLEALSRLPANTIQVLGQKRKNLDGKSSKAEVRHVGHIWECPLIFQVPPSLRVRAARLIAGKVSLGARFDAYRTSHSASLDMGRKFVEEIEEKFEKWQEPPPSKQIKPLPAPAIVSKKRRGGTRSRRMKEATRPSELQKMRNRLQFGVPEEEIGYSGVGLGMLGQEGSGVIRVHSDSKTKLKAAKKVRNRMVAAGIPGAATVLSSGMTTSFTMDATHTLELPSGFKKETVAPSSDGTATYFAPTSGFVSLRPPTQRK